MSESEQKLGREARFRLVFVGNEFSDQYARARLERPFAMVSAAHVGIVVGVGLDE